jgi:two-component sensor histidine kinase
MNTDAPTAQQIARIRRYQEILTDFGRMAPDASDNARVLQLACVQASRGIGIGHTKVMRFRPEAGDLLIVAGVGWHPGVVGHIALGTDLASPPGRTFQTRLPTVIDDLPNDREFRYSAVLRDHGIISVLQAPIAVGGAMWGVMEVDSETPRHFGVDDVQFLSALANILGLALHGRLGLQQAALAEAATSKALLQERTLLAELRHRSKNDLQLILGMLVMQKRKHADEEAGNGYSLLMDRVAAIGMAHDQLAPGRGAGMVELSEYLTTLCGNLAQRRETVRIEIALARTEMPHERAVPVGLVVNELVTNALKYAFPDDRAGRIEVQFEIAPPGEGRLTVSDDGVGMGPPRPGSSGTELVRRLVQQIGGRLEREQRPQGTCIVITFPLVT